MTISDWAIVLATLLGPILAVQAQKWIEHWRSEEMRRAYVFDTLMTTRGTRLSPEHIRTLNMIPLAYHDRGRTHRSAKCQAVLTEWKSYLDILGTNVDGWEQNRLEDLWTRRDTAFRKLLFAMAAERKFEVDDVDLQKGAYHPMASVNQEMTSNSVMQNALEVLAGQRPIRVAVEPDVGNAQQQNPID